MPANVNPSMPMRAPYRRRLAVGLLWVVAALVLGLAACSSDAAEEPVEPVGPAADGLDVTADDVVWQVFRGTTDYSPATLAQEVPDLTVYGDGRAFVADPTATGGPRTMELGSIAPDELADLLATAQDSGLFQPGTDYGAADRTDLPLTTIVVADGSIPLTAAVVGLSADDLELDDAQQEARDGLAALVAEAASLVADAEPWTPDRVRAVFIGPDAEPDIDAGSAVEWPGPAFDEFPATDDFSGTSCLLLGEPDAAAVWGAALDNPGATWTEEDELRQIVVAPVLPGEEGCAHDHDDEDHGDGDDAEDGPAGQDPEVSGD